MRTFSDTEDWYIISLGFSDTPRSMETIATFLVGHETDAVFVLEDIKDSNQYTYIGDYYPTITYSTAEYYVEQSDCANRCRELLLHTLSKFKGELSISWLRDSIKSTYIRKK